MRRLSPPGAPGPPAPPARPDHAARDPGSLAAQFEHFGEVECPQLDARIYQVLCRGIQGDPELLAIAALAGPGQPAPNLLFAAVHDLLLAGDEHPLRDWYPALAVADPQPAESAFAPFRDFCLARREAVESRVATRLTQTNVLQRCSALLPAFARVFVEGGGVPLALIEIGPSAGLNLQWDRFHYVYASEGAVHASEGAAMRAGAPRWGDPASPVRIYCLLRQGGAALPPLPDEIPVAWRRGVDVHPVDLGDPDAVRWLRALVWPDHPGRQERLTAAIGIARRQPPRIVAGDAASCLPELIESAPRGVTLCVYGTHTLYQFPREALRATLRAMQDASHARPVHFVGMEGTGDRCSELKHTRYAAGARATSHLADCNPHGRWLRWLAPPEERSY